MVKLKKSWLGKPVKVLWLDHVGHGPDWTTKKKARSKKLATFESVGFLHDFDSRQLVLVGSLERRGKTAGDIFVCVRPAVISITPL